MSDPRSNSAPNPDPDPASDSLPPANPTSRLRPRLRMLSIAAVLVAAGVVLLAWSQPWFTFHLVADQLAADPGADHLAGAAHVVGGDVAGGALLPLALASLAVAPALALAGVVFRVVLGVLNALLGVCIVLACAWSLGDPVSASLPDLVDATGIATADALRDALTGPVPSAWPFVALVGGCLVVLAGLWVAVTARAWPVTRSRYSRTRLATPGGDPVGDLAGDLAPDPIHDWDALTDGEDPTEPTGPTR